MAMNIAQAKRIPLESVLAQLGHTPTRTQGADIWYHSPFRDEQDASFKINRSMNAWYDHGAGKGGTVLELIQQLYRLPDIVQTLNKLREIMGNARGCEVSPRREKTAATKIAPAIKLRTVKPLTSRPLLAYLEKRGIDAEAVAPFIKQVHYHAKGKDYFAIGFANDSGGFELRNPYFKGSTSKDITTVPGRTDRVLIFEGFFDFLTAATMNFGNLPTAAIVLNSVGMKDKAIAKVRELNATSVELYRDNDTAGEALIRYFRSQLPDRVVIDKAEAYPESKDLNAWHVTQR